MTIVAVMGDLTTTTSVALASSWPRESHVLLIEADPHGGDLAAWFDISVEPSLSSVVTQVRDGSWGEIEGLTRPSSVGLRLIPAPVSAREATRAVAETGRALVPGLAVLSAPVTVADTGRFQPDPTSNPFVAAASVIVLVHRQTTQSPRAAAVRIQRFADQIESLSALSTEVIGVVIGDAPFGVDEIESLLERSVGSTVLVALPIDELTAAALGGRAGVSRRRLARLPLMRASGELAEAVARCLGDETGGRPDGHRRRP